jgi:hypothetical protein
LLGNDSVIHNNEVTVGSVVFCAVRIEEWLRLRESLEIAVTIVGVSVKWATDCEDVSPAAEERPLLEAVTKQRSQDSDWEH